MERRKAKRSRTRMDDEEEKEGRIKSGVFLLEGTGGKGRETRMEERRMWRGRRRGWRGGSRKEHQ